MTDKKITALTADTGPTKDDLILTVNDPGSTPGSRKVTLEDVHRIINVLTALGATPATDDVLPLYDTSATAPRKTTVAEVGAAVSATVIGVNNQTTTRYVEVEPFSMKDSTDWAVGDGVAYLAIPSELAGYNLVEVQADVRTAGTTGTGDLQIANVTDTTDMLSTKLTIDSGETSSRTAATPAVINTSYDDVAAGDILRIDCDAKHTTAARGCIVTLGFRKP